MWQLHTDYDSTYIVCRENPQQIRYPAKIRPGNVHVYLLRRAGILLICMLHTAQTVNTVIFHMCPYSICIPPYFSSVIYKWKAESGSGNHFHFDSVFCTTETNIKYRMENGKYSMSTPAASGWPKWRLITSGQRRCSVVVDDLKARLLPVTASMK